MEYEGSQFEYDDWMDTKEEYQRRVDQEADEREKDEDHRVDCLISRMQNYAPISRVFEHPGTQEPGWVTEVWETSSHEESEKVAETLVGWKVWLVANEGVPAIVVYRRTK